MTFSLLPDSAGYPNPRFSWFLACCFDVLVGKLYRIERVVPEGYRLQPRTLIVSNHLRDSDVPILMVALCRRQGLRFRDPLPFFAAREDLFQRDALASLSWPAPPFRLLGLIPVGWFLRSLRARPMRRLREFTLAETVEALRSAGLEAMDPAEVLNARGQREIMAQLGALPSRLAAITSSQLGRLGCSIWGLRRLRLATLRQIESILRAHIAEQLAGFTALLEEGRTVYVAPEGVISRTGRFGRIRAAPRHLCRRSALPMAILPNALSYDPLREGRLRVVVRVGEPIRDLGGTDPRQFASHLRAAILRLRVVTSSHLTAWFLCAGPAQFTTHEFAAWLRHGIEIAAVAGLAVDPLLGRVRLASLAGEHLRWLQRRRLIRRHGTLWLNTWPRHTQPGWSTPAGIVAFLANSLADLSPQWRHAPRK